jgi:hypothetical protein
MATYARERKQRENRGNYYCPEEDKKQRTLDDFKDSSALQGESPSS